MSSVVTGAFGYIGRYITRHLLDLGEEVLTITTHPDKPNPFGERVKAYTYHFDRPDLLIESLREASTLYNTYWIRFEYGGATFQQAVENTAVLFRCAREAGIEKIVHIGVNQASLESDLPYYAGKAQQEVVLRDCGVPYSILRPTLVIGREDILVNNIAWLIRTFPVFPIFGSGDYRLQPVYVADLAEIAVAAASNPDVNLQDVIGPETYTFEAFVRTTAAALKPNIRLLHLPPGLGIVLGRLIGLLTGDILLTRAELKGLMDEMLTSERAPNASTRFSEWLVDNAAGLGVSYTSELARHFKWKQR